MRLARIRPELAKLRKRVAAAGPRVRKIKIDSLAGFHDVDIDLDNSLLAVCGGTGIGKTTFLAALFSGLAELGEEDVRHCEGRPSNFEVDIALDTPTGLYQSKRSFLEKCPASAGYQNAFFDDIDIRTSISRTTMHGDKVDALKEGTEPFELVVEGREFLSQICRKQYTSFRVYELEAEEGLVYPYFEVVDNGLAYSSETMGSGEHSACYLAWRLSTAPALSILCLEEPEAFLPPVAHDFVLAMITHFALLRRLLPIFTTHSPDIVSSLSDGDFISLSRRSQKVFAPKTSEAKSRVLARLGLGPTITCNALVEDLVGKIVLEEVLATFDFQLVATINVIITVGGAGRINTALLGIPSELPRSVIFGVLDGDMRVEAGSWESKDRLLFIPFEVAPEIEMIAAIENHQKSFSKRILRSLNSLQQVISDTRGTDHHDRMVAMADGLGVPFDGFVRAAFQHWIQRQGKKALVKRFARELSELLGVVPPDL